MRIFWLALGWVTLALGMIGALLPIMPTVPFLIVAVWAFSRSSPELRDRILHHKTFGPPIRAWHERGVIARSAKFWTTLAMAAGLCWSFYLGIPPNVVAAQATICIAVVIFLLTRPEG